MGCQNQCSILLVEDHADLREVTAYVLEESDFRVIQAENGQEALERLYQMEGGPKAILLDLMMPVMNGWQFLDALQKLPDFATVPVVVLSAMENDWPVNVFGHLKKPADSEVIVSQLRKACCAHSYPKS